MSQSTAQKYFTQQSNPQSTLNLSIDIYNHIQLFKSQINKLKRSLQDPLQDQSSIAQLISASKLRPQKLPKPKKGNPLSNKRNYFKFKLIMQNQNVRKIEKS